MKNFSSIALWIAVGLAFVSTRVQADDWPQWRGPQRNGISHEKGFLKAWPQGGPKVLWQVKDLGSGYSTPSIVGDQIYLLANEGLENEFVRALSVKDGKRIWTTRLGKVGNPDQQPSYPAARSTPTADGERLYALGSDGDLVCLDRETGKARWQKNLRTDFNGQPGAWAYAESPLVDGEAVICTPGGALIQLNVKDGQVEVEPVYFETKLPTSIGGAVVAGDHLFGTTGQSLVCAEFSTGKINWQERCVGPGSVCYADGRLYVHGENGDLALVEATPDAYRESGRFTPPGQPNRRRSKAWAYPAIADGKLFIRDLDTLWCYDIKETKLAR